MMNASLDLEFTKMHDDLDEKEEKGEDSKVIVRNQVASTRSASIAKKPPVLIYFRPKEYHKNVFNSFF